MNSGDLFLKRLRTAEHRDLKFSKVVLRLGSRLASSKREEYEFSLPLLHLVTHSMKIRRWMASSWCDDGRCSGSIVVDMPDLHCEVDILRMVEDIVGDTCCGLMDANDISTSNVVGLFKVANSLEVEIIKCKALAFLENNAFLSWEKCLDVLATFNCNDLPWPSPAWSWTGRIGETLFKRCREAFLVKIPMKLVPASNTVTKSCNVICLLQVAKFLSPSVAKHIFESCRKESFGLCLQWSDSSLVIHISCHLKQNSRSLEEFPFENKFYGTDVSISDACSEVSWIEELPNLLPDLSDRSLLVLYLSKMMRLGNDATAGISCSFLRWSFLCGLLVEATRLSTRAEELKNDLDGEIGFLEKLVTQGLAHPDEKLSNFTEVLKLVIRLTFDTLLSIVTRFQSFVSGENIDRVAKVIDNCILENLKTSSFSTQQALKIYKAFPNDARQSHSELYTTMRTAALSTQEVVTLSKLLDYKKVPDDMIEKLFGDREFDWGPQLVKRFWEIQEVKRIEKERGDRELTKLMRELSLQTADFTTLRSELSLKTADLESKLSLQTAEVTTLRRQLSLQTAEVTTLRRELSLKTAELVKVIMDKEHEETKFQDEIKRMVKIQNANKEELIQLQSEPNALREALTLVESLRDVAQYGLEEEKEKTTCQICFENPRDALLLPCMHFLYCIKCLNHNHQQLKTCPACRAFTSGVLKCILAM